MFTSPMRRKVNNIIIIITSRVTIIIVPACMGRMLHIRSECRLKLDVCYSYANIKSGLTVLISCYYRRRVTLIATANVIASVHSEGVVGVGENDPLH